MESFYFSILDEARLYSIGIPGKAVTKYRGPRMCIRVPTSPASMHSLQQRSLSSNSNPTIILSIAQFANTSHNVRQESLQEGQEDG